MTAVPPAAPVERAPRRLPRAPGAAVLVITVAVAVMVAVTGLTSRTAPPPTVAQFAPQAVQQIKDAPKDQSSRFGAGDGEGRDGPGDEPGEGGTGGGTPAPTATAASPAPEGPPGLRCVGDPPRQIEDTQSPPCIAYWEGDNGGATWKGVTADEIRVAVPQYPKVDAFDEVKALESFFNKRFQLYGRKLVLFNPEAKNSDLPEDQRNDAAKVDSLRAFASAGYSYNHYYAKELARRGIVSATGEPYYSEAQLREMSPHVWQYSMSMDRQMANSGAWVCNRVAGRPARHAGDPTFQQQPRKFGVVHYNTFPEVPVGLGPLLERLEGCGAKPAVVLDKGTVGNAISPTEAQNTALQLKDAGVTSVICTCNYVQLAVLFRGSTTQAYFPEWLTGTYFFNDSDYALHQFNGDQTHLDHSFGITFRPRELRPENTPATWAVLEGAGRPDGPSGRTSGGMWNRTTLYRELLLIASGIQMAGPKLTPETFRAGLQRTVFPNPPDPSNQGRVGFEGDHSMTDDVGEYYWSSRATSPYADTAGQGALCYVESGRRRTLDTWPKSEPPLGQFPCDSRDR